MLGIFRNLFSDAPANRVKSGGPVTPIADTKPPTPIAPNDDTEAERNKVSVNAFVCREAILDRQECIVGYEFSLHEQMRSRIQDMRELVQKVYDDALLRNLTSIAVDSLLGQRMAFIRLCPISLGNPLILQLPRKQTILIVSPTQQGLDPQQVAIDLARLSDAGFSYGWVLRRKQLKTYPDLLELAAAGDFVEFKTGSFDGLEISTLARTLRQTRQKMSLSREPSLPLQLIARELPTYDDFHLCFQAGFDLFHGPFVAAHENWRPPESELNRVHLMEILNLVRSDADFSLIAEHLKREPVLSFKLLRYLNSAAMGFQKNITSISQALTLLGRDKFYRWLSLLLFDLKNPGYRERVLTEQALVRGRFLENLAGQGKLPADKDHLFLLGLFSQINVLLGRPMPDILKQARLPEPVEKALLGEAGDWFDALQLAIAAQEIDAEAMASTASRCQVNELQVSRSAMDALAWASNLTATDPA